MSTPSAIIHCLTTIELRFFAVFQPHSYGDRAVYKVRNEKWKDVVASLIEKDYLIALDEREEKHGVVYDLYRLTDRALIIYNTIKD